MTTSHSYCTCSKQPTNILLRIYVDTVPSCNVHWYNLSIHPAIGDSTVQSHTFTLHSTHGLVLLHWQHHFYEEDVPSLPSPLPCAPVNVLRAPWTATSWRKQRKHRPARLPTPSWYLRNACVFVGEFCCHVNGTDENRVRPGFDPVSPTRVRPGYVSMWKGYLTAK